MPVAAIEAIRSASAAMALRRGRLPTFADDLLAGLANDLLPGLFLDIGLLSSPDRTKRDTHHECD
jgi:hypothetical protein